MKLKYEPGTRFSNSVIYDEATSEVVSGWQVFMQKLPDGTATGCRSFVNNAGILCGIEVANAMRERAIRDAAPQLLEALSALLVEAEQFAIELQPYAASPALAQARAAKALAAGITP